MFIGKASFSRSASLSPQSAEVVCESPLLTGRVIGRLAEDLDARKSALSRMADEIGQLCQTHGERDGLQPSNGLQPRSDGVQPTRGTVE